MIDELLARLAENQLRLWGKELPSPASPERIAAAEAWIEEEFGATLPPDLIEFWSRTQNAGGNGVLLFGPSEAVDQTEMFRFDEPIPLLVAQQDSEFYGYDPRLSAFGRYGLGDFEEQPAESWPTWTALLEVLVQHIVE